jgi:hypothetical protein
MRIYVFLSASVFLELPLFNWLIILYGQRDGSGMKKIRNISVETNFTDLGYLAPLRERPRSFFILGFCEFANFDVLLYYRDGKQDIDFFVLF